MRRAGGRAGRRPEVLSDWAARSDARPIGWSVVVSAIVVVAVAPARADQRAFPYPDSLVEDLATVYAENIRWNLDHAILGGLTAGQRGSLADVRLDMAPRSPQPDALGFGFTVEPPSMVLPAASIKLLDDIAVARAWLSLNGHTTGTVRDYLALIRFRRPEELPGGRYPEPLAALGIPVKAGEYGEVATESGRMTKSAVVFVVAHQLGHLVLAHGRPVSGPAAPREAAADSIAVAVFERLGVVPVGLSHLFELTAYLGAHPADFPSDSAWSAFQETTAPHPLDGKRLRRLADRLVTSGPAMAQREPDYQGALRQVREIADQLSNLANIYDDVGGWAQLKQKGERLLLEDLKTRQ